MRQVSVLVTEVIFFLPGSKLVEETTSKNEVPVSTKRPDSTLSKTTASKDNQLEVTAIDPITNPGAHIDGMNISPVEGLEFSSDIGPKQEEIETSLSGFTTLIHTATDSPKNVSALGNIVVTVAEKHRVANGIQYIFIPK